MRKVPTLNREILEIRFNEDSTSKSKEICIQRSIQVTQRKFVLLCKELNDIALDDDLREEQLVAKINNSQTEGVNRTSESDRMSSRRTSSFVNYTFSLEDIPRFQLSNMNKLYFLSKVVYDDVNAFNSAYEFFMSTAGLDCKSRWKSFINREVCGVTFSKELFFLNQTQ
ncbi:hypothetical protein F4703DRAFT_1788833 [Phycomyces blakesleeanus]